MRPGRMRARTRWARARERVKKRPAFDNGFCGTINTKNAGTWEGRAGNRGGNERVDNDNTSDERYTGGRDTIFVRAETE